MHNPHQILPDVFTDVMTEISIIIRKSWYASFGTKVLKSVHTTVHHKLLISVGTSFLLYVKSYILRDLSAECPYYNLNDLPMLGLHDVWSKLRFYITSDFRSFGCPNATMSSCPYMSHDNRIGTHQLMSFFTVPHGRIKNEAQ